MKSVEMKIDRRSCTMSDRMALFASVPLVAARVRIEKTAGFLASRPRTQRRRCGCGCCFLRVSATRLVPILDHEARRSAVKLFQGIDRVADVLDRAVELLLGIDAGLGDFPHEEPHDLRTRSHHPERKVFQATNPRGDRRGHFPFSLPTGAARRRSSRYAAPRAPLVGTPRERFPLPQKYSPPVPGSPSIQPSY